MSLLNEVLSSRLLAGATVAVCAALLIPVLGMALFGSAHGEEGIPLPPPTTDLPKPSDNRSQVAVVAGGCFWGVQGVYQHVKGVQRVLSGYAGGEAATAHYDMIGSGRTGHAESVEIVFDPNQISYGEILRIFFSVVHDPTQLNRQGPDEGPQYRSAIFYVDPEQKKVAEAYIAQLNAAKKLKKAIVTKVDSLRKFHPAEDYHQDYLVLNARQPYIVYNDLPKIANLKRIMPEVWRDDPVTVASTRSR
jgi:peptide-methionine (S)-S-oxide reductase